MTIFFFILSAVLLVAVAFQDFKRRQISWWLLPLLFLSLLFNALMTTNLKTILFSLAINVGFILLQHICLTIYFSMKKGKGINIINSYIGIGDILFLLVLCVSFSPLNFIVFYVAGLTITLLFSLVVKMLVKNNAWKEIPLVGMLSVVFMLFLLRNHWHSDFNFFNDQYLLKGIQFTKMHF